MEILPKGRPRRITAKGSNEIVYKVRRMADNMRRITRAFADTADMIRNMNVEKAIKGIS